MAITRLNHAVLYVRDVAATQAFYEEVLGFRVVTSMPGRAAFLQAPGSNNDHDIGLFQIGSAAAASDAGRRTVGLYHLAWEVDTLAELARLADVLRDSGSLVGMSDHGTTKSLYAVDPDGLEFEVCWVLPASALDDEVIDDMHRSPRIAPLDLDAEIAHFGATTRGGVGVSIPA